MAWSLLGCNRGCTGVLGQKLTASGCQGHAEKNPEKSKIDALPIRTPQSGSVCLRRRATRLRGELFCYCESTG
jgi:hypothetical protein